MKTSWINSKRVISTFKFGYPRLTLKEGSKVKSDHIKRFLAHEFLSVGFTLQTSRTNNKQVILISTFKFGYPRLTLKEGPKVKSEHIKRFPAHDFLEVGFTFQTSKTNNKQVISTFKFACFFFIADVSNGIDVDADSSSEIEFKVNRSTTRCDNLKL